MASKDSLSAGPPAHSIPPGSGLAAGPRGSPLPRDAETQTASLAGDLVEKPLSAWDSAWIDLGGEG